MSEVVIIKTEYLPPISTFWGIMNSDQVLLEVCETYQKKSTRNRTKILGVNTVEMLSIPLKKGKRRNRPIQEVQIAYDDNWSSKHLHSIRSAYGNSPYFDFYYDDLKDILTSKTDYLLDLNNKLLQFLIDAIGLDVNIESTSTFIKEYPGTHLDLRNLPFENPEIPNYEAKPYNQVFEEKHGFVENLSILDLLMCKGPESILYI